MSRGDAEGVHTAPVIPLNRYWMNLRVAAEHVDVEFPDVIAAVARHEMHAVDDTQGRPGVWMVRMLEVEAWAEKRAQLVG